MRISRRKLQRLCIWVVAPCSLLGRTDVSHNTVVYIFKLRKNYFWLTETNRMFFRKVDQWIINSSSSTGTTTPCWVLACSTIVEPSQQEGFYWVLLPAARQTPNLEDQWLERSNSRHKAPPAASETTQANPSSRKWNYAREMAENFAESGDFHITFGFFYMP